MQASWAREGGGTVRRYVQAFFRHPFLLTLPVVVALGVSLGYQLRQPRVYQASVSMWCDAPVPSQSTIFSNTSEQPAAAQLVVLTELLQTRAFLVKVGQSGPWASSVAAHPGPDGDGLLFSLGSNVSVSAPGHQELVIKTKGAHPGDALALAKSVSDAYIAEEDNTQRVRARSSVGFYQAEVKQASTELAAAQDKLNQYLQANQTTGPLGAAADAAITQFSQAVNAAQSNYDQASSHLSEAGLGLSSVTESGVLSVYDAPRTTGLPISRKKKIVFAGVAGLFAGAMVSLILLLFLVMGDRSVHGPGEIEDLLGMEVVGTIDEFKTKPRRRQMS